jgi:hypothetical protein
MAQNLIIYFAVINAINLKKRSLNYVEKERGEERGEKGKFVEGVVQR